MFAIPIGPLGLDEGGHDLGIVSVGGLVRRVVSRVRQALCGLRGHEMVRHFESARLSLRCVACGAETPGWTIDVRPAFRSGGPAHARVQHPVKGDQCGSITRNNRSNLDVATVSIAGDAS